MKRIILNEKQELLNGFKSFLSNKNFYFEHLRPKIKVAQELQDKHRLDFLGEICALHRTIVHLNINCKSINCKKQPDFYIVDQNEIKYVIEITSASTGNTTLRGIQSILENELDIFLKENKANFTAKDIIKSIPPISKPPITEKEYMKNMNRLWFYLQCLFDDQKAVDKLSLQDKKILCEFIKEKTKTKIIFTKDTVECYRKTLLERILNCQVSDSDLKNFTTNCVNETYDNYHKVFAVELVIERIKDKFNKYSKCITPNSERILVVDTEKGYSYFFDEHESKNIQKYKNLILEMDHFKQQNNYFNCVIIIQSSTQQYYLLKYSETKGEWEFKQSITTGSSR